MEKLDFIKKAPPYISFAIAKAAQWSIGKMLTRREIESAVGVDFFRDGLWAAGIDLLKKEGLIEIVKHDFGPEIYVPVEGVESWITEVAPSRWSWVSIAEQKGANWLHTALGDISDQYEMLGIKSSDFATVEEAEWEPMAINRDDPKFKAVAELVDEAIEQIEGDNGYPVHAPEEREYVVSSLKNFRKLISENASLYAQQIKVFAIDPLTQAVKRFGEAGAGLAASAAKQAVFEYLKSHAAKILNLLW